MHDMQAETDKVAENDYLDLLNISTKFGEERIINYSNRLDLSIQMKKMEILIHELLHMFEKQVLMLTRFYLKKFIVKVSVKTRETHFSPLSLLDPLLIQVLNIVVNLVFLVLLLQAMMTQDERGPMMVVILEIMVEIMQIDNNNSILVHNYDFYMLNYYLHGNVKILIFSI